MMIKKIVYGSSVVTFRVWPSGNFVITSIIRGNENVTKSITANRYASGIVRWSIANGQISL